MTFAFAFQGADYMESFQPELHEFQPGSWAEISARPKDKILLKPKLE
jgi:hypothetical protein